MYLSLFDKELSGGEGDSPLSGSTQHVMSDAGISSSIWLKILSAEVGSAARLGA